ncbi:MAG: molybdopterin-binding protein, partial [bacterium]
MIAEVVSIGTELLLGQITDTNAAYLGKVLAGIGIPVYRRQTVGDNLERVADAIKLALSRSDLLVIIAGLGPTEDDLTREGIAAAIGEDLIFDPDLQA